PGIGNVRLNKYFYISAATGVAVAKFQAKANIEMVETPKRIVLFLILKTGSGTLSGACPSSRVRPSDGLDRNQPERLNHPIRKLVPMQIKSIKTDIKVLNGMV
ncbi:hypothetical protein, partial [Aquidulcibacter paucihalophilus]|uniref:hypothetical protein n=1 Tax=Aquidulcibacter paucihalophilus TaxID=1978549 RepID=UPI001E3147EB